MNPTRQTDTNGGSILAYTLRHTLPAAYALLPPPMASAEATALLIAIGLQETQFAVRRQRGGGPARSFLQFERGGLAGLLAHPRSRPHLLHALSVLQYPTEPPAEVLRVCLLAVEHHDPLAFAAGRLLLWTLPDALPTKDNAVGAWGQYLDAWQPGAAKKDPKPHLKRWMDNYPRAWELVDPRPPHAVETP